MSVEFTILDLRDDLARLSNPDIAWPDVRGFVKPSVAEDFRIDITRMIAIIDAMFPEEVADITLLRDSIRKDRIASETGCDIEEIANLVSCYSRMRDTIKRLRNGPSGIVELPPNHEWRI
jgi:signal recognition particle GTPase